MEGWRRSEFLAELCPRVRPLASCVLACGCGCEILDLFRRRPQTWLEAEDVAFHVKQPPEHTLAELNQLAAGGILKRHVVLSTPFFGLTEETQVLDELEQFWCRRDDWHIRLNEARVDLSLGSTLPAKAVAAPIRF